jgi:hypothetical protein
MFAYASLTNFFPLDTTLALGPTCFFDPVLFFSASVDIFFIGTLQNSFPRSLITLLDRVRWGGGGFYRAVEARLLLTSDTDNGALDFLFNLRGSIAEVTETLLWSRVLGIFLSSC